MHVDLEMPWARSLKEKRSLVLPLVERLRSRFPVSVARVAGLDRHDRERIAIAAVGSDAAVLHGLMSRVTGFLEGGEVGARVVRLEVEVWDEEDPR